MSESVWPMCACSHCKGGPMSCCVNVEVHKEIVAALEAKLAVAVSCLKKIGHRLEPQALSCEAALGYLMACEDVIKEAKEALEIIGGGA